MEQKEEILSPLEIGDNQEVYQLNDQLKLIYGFFDDYYLKLVNENSIVVEWHKKKDILKFKSIEKDLVDKASLFLPDLKKLGVQYQITKAYMQFATKKSQIDTKNIRRYDVSDVSDVTLGGGNNNSEIFFEEKHLVQQQNSVMGWFKERMYFGIMMPVSQPKINKEGEILGQEIVPKLVWVFDDKTHTIITNKYQENNNIQIKGQPTEPTPRWSLTKIQEWVYATKTRQYPTLTPQQLFNKIKEQLQKYIWFDDQHYYDILPLWIIGTYCYQIFTAYPYINLWGLKNTGKTKVMDLTNILAFNSASFVNMSVASLFRIIELDNPTLFIDEAENLWQPQQKGDDETSEIVACLNAGWMKGKQVPRVEKIDGEQTIVKFKVYCPKMLASIKGLKGALDSRCIRIIMIRPRGQASSQLWAEENDSELLAIRNEIYPFILSNWSMIKAYYSGVGLELKNSFGIDNRDWQIWKPLLCIAKLVSDDLVRSVGEWAYDECEFNKDDSIDEESWDNKIFTGLQNLVQSEDQVKYSVAMIKEAVDNEFVEKTYFDNYQNKDVQVLRKERPSSKFIGKLLNKVGFKQYHFRDKVRGYKLSKKILLHILSTLQCNVVNVGNVVTSYMKPENMILLLQSLKDTLKTIPSFVQIKESLKDISDEELLKTLNYMKEQKMIFEPAGLPDHFEVLS